MDKHKLIFPVVILLSTIIFSISYYITQINIQKSIERQQNIKARYELEKQKTDIEARVTAEEAKINSEAVKENDTKTKQEECLTEAHNRYIAEADAECSLRGYTKEQTNNLECKLPADTINRLEKKQKDEQDFCLKLYKTN